MLTYVKVLNIKSHLNASIQNVNHITENQNLRLQKKNCLKLHSLNTWF